MGAVNHLRDLRPDQKNARRHNPRNVSMIEDALREVGAARSIVIDEHGTVLAGNATIEAAAAAGIERVQVVDADGQTIIAVRRSGLTDHQKQRLALYDNRAAELADWDGAVLTDLLAEDAKALVGLFEVDEIDALLHRLDEDQAAASSLSAPRPTLSDRFIVPPFSVLDARQGYWQERKRAWLGYGIQSELGRGEASTPGSDNDHRPGRDGGDYSGGHAWLANRVSPGGSLRDATTLGPDGKTQRGDGRGRGLARSFGQDLMRGEHVVGQPKPDSRAIKDHAWQAAHLARPQARLTWVAGDRPVDDLDETSLKILEAQPQSGTSIFDPVLCELAYRWFSPPTGHVLDPFAGGSVRGIIASLLGRSYTGIDLSAVQVAANEEQANQIVPDRRPRWLVGDSRDLAQLAPGTYDLVFTCPPYADLEVYSDDPRDLSTLAYADFLTAYRTIIAAAVAMLAPDRFACIVVGDVRDPRGLYRNFVSDTIGAFQGAGAALYNEAILVTAVGSLPIRVGRQFESGRKLGKTHQNVLVFVKGDPRRATEACGPVEVMLPQPDDAAITDAWEVVHA